LSSSAFLAIIIECSFDCNLTCHFCLCGVPSGSGVRRCDKRAVRMSAIERVEARPPAGEDFHASIECGVTRPMSTPPGGGGACAIFALNMSPRSGIPCSRTTTMTPTAVKPTYARQRRETNHPPRGGDSKWRNYQINFFHFGQRKSVLGGGGRRSTRKCVETNILLKGVFDACSM